MFTSTIILSVNLVFVLFEELIIKEQSLKFNQYIKKIIWDWTAFLHLHLPLELERSSRNALNNAASARLLTKKNIGQILLLKADHSSLGTKANDDNVAEQGMPCPTLIMELSVLA